MKPYQIMLAMIPLVVVMGSAHAQPFPFVEHGENYDRQFVGYTEDGRGIFNWTSHPDRLKLSDGKFVNYKLNEDESTITYESKSVTTRFDKSTSAFRIYDSGIISTNELPIIQSITHTIKQAPNGTDDWTQSEINNSSPQWIVDGQEDQATITARKDTRNMLGMGQVFDVVYKIDVFGRLKWTYELGNFQPFNDNTKYGFTTVFNGPFAITIDGATYHTNKVDGVISISANDIKDQIITISNGSFKVDFDTQNYIHDYLWMIKIQNNKVIFDFTYSKGALRSGETLRVDPTFGYTAAQSQQSVYTGVTAQCLGASATTNGTAASTTYRVYVPSTGAADNCIGQLTKFIITSIPDGVTITSGSLRHDRGAAGASTNVRLMIFRNVTLDPQGSASPAQKWIPMTQGNFAVSPFTESAANTNDIVTALNTNGTAAVQNALSNNYIGFAPMFVNQKSDASQHIIENLQNFELQVTYISSPPPTPTTFTAVSQARKVQFDWTISNGTGINTYYIGRSLDNSTWPAANKTNVGNVTTYLSTAYWAVNKLYYTNVTANNGINGSSKYASFTTDTYPSAPLNPYTTALSDTSIKLNWSPPSSTGNDPITGYRIQYCITCTSWTLLVNNTNTLNYNHTGLIGSPTVKYRMAAWNGVGLSSFTANFTGTTFRATTGSLTTTSGVVGDTIQVNSTITITHASPSPVTVSQLKLYRNGTLIETKNISVQINNGSSSSNFAPFWNRMLTGSTYSFKMYATVSNSTGTVQLASSNFTATRQYDPTYFNAQTDPATEGLVNYTLDRFSNEDGIYLRVNRYGGSLGGTWEIDCISQTNSEAAATRNQSLNWPGTWRNYSNVGYFNSTWTDFRNTHGYITCFNPPGILFSTTSYTNSSLALFGIQIFDDSYGAMLGVPVGIFFLAMAGAMANKRTAPTWIIVVLAMAGTMAAIGFFTLNPLVWGLALVTGLLGVLVNQKVF